MKNRKCNPFRYLASCVLAGLTFTLSLALPARAVLIELLPVETVAFTGFTHRAIISATDVNSSANTIQTLVLSTASLTATNLGTNVLIDRVAFVVQGNWTNVIADNTNLLMYIGIGGGPVPSGATTNTFFSAIDIDNRSLQAAPNGGTGPGSWMGATNLSKQLNTGSNSLVAVFKGVGGTPLLSGYMTNSANRISIYWRMLDMNNYKSQ